MGIVFTPFTQEEMIAGVHAIAEAAAPWAPALLVGIGRGGLSPAVFLSHRMGVPMVSLDLSARLAPFGEGLLPLLAERSRAGERLLFVDDINDSGKTIGGLRAALAEAGAAMAGVRFAVLLDNIRSAERIDYAARAIDRAVTKDWFVFPWEAMAPASTLAQDAQEVPSRIA